MKFIYFKAFVILITFSAFHFTSQAQDMLADSTGLLGDNFSLEGALEIFKKSDNLESFEKMLNDEDNYINNLDLNDDGEVDYIKVVDQMDDDVHAIILQIPVSKKESQDIAVIEIEKTGTSSAMLQIVGDENLYGPNHIIEPVDETTSGGKGGPEPVYETERIIVDVWGWSIVRFIYAPGYRIYVSPWGWAHYPPWWITWKPHSWRWYHTRRVHYRVGFGFATTHRVVRAHRIYQPVRRTSVTVKTKSVKRVSVRNASNTRKVANAKVASSGKSVSASKTTKTTKIQKDGNKIKAGQKKTTTKVTKKKSGAVKGSKTSSKTKVKKKKGKGAKKTKKTKKTTVKKKKGKGA